MPRSKLSSRTKKAISDLSPKQKHIFKKAHASALKQYRNPSKRRNKGERAEAVAHKVAWSAVKKSKGRKKSKK